MTLVILISFQTKHKQFLKPWQSDARLFQQHFSMQARFVRKMKNLKKYQMRRSEVSDQR